MRRIELDRGVAKTGQVRRVRSSVTVVLLLLATLAWLLAWAQDAALRLRLLSTTDIHTHIVDYDYYRDQRDVSVGLARTATLIGQARSEVRNSLLFDSGDLIQGNPLGDYVAVEQRLQPGQVHPVFKALNLLDYAAASLGNHEFNYGLDFLRLALAGARFPYVTANVFVAGPDRVAAPPLIPPYVILDRDFIDEVGTTRRLRVGVIGFVPPQIMQWDKANLDGRAFVIDIVEAARRYVPQMRAAGADLVVALVHSGFSAVPARGMDENAAAYLAQVPGIDAILAGHSHLVFPDPSFSNLPGVDVARGTINGVPTVMAGFWGSHLGVVDLTLRRTADGWRRVDGIAATRGIRRRENNQWVAAVDPDPAIVAAVQPEHTGTLAYVRRPVARSTARIHSYFALVQDDPSVQLVARAQAAYIRRVLQGGPHAGLPVLSAAAPFKAGGRGGPAYYTDVPAGDLAIRNVADLYLYPNTVRAVRVSGTIVREWLEMSAGQFNRIDPAVTTPQLLINPAFPTFNYDVIDGVTYRIDVTQPARYTPQGRIADAQARRIVDLTFRGQPVTDAMEFVVATNNYRASGGGNFPGMDGSNIVFETGETNQEIIKDWLIAQKTVDATVTPIWSFLPIATPVQVVFESSPEAKSLTGAGTRIRHVGEGKNGFELYALTLR
jgi:2',3'-cyclic-nucleotide 2'-phosphodiesterase/3'-nucleotidase